MKKIKRLLQKNAANIITLIGLITVLHLAYLLFLKSNCWAKIFFDALVVGASDMADGFVARRLKIESRLGAFLDVFRDKLFFFTVVIASAWHYWPPENVGSLIVAFTQLIAGALFAAEMILAVGTVIAFAEGQRDFESVEDGKYKMNYLIIGIFIWFAALGVKHYWDIPVMESFLIAVDVCFLIAIYYWMQSFLHYWRRYIKNKNSRHQEPPYIDFC